MQSKVSVHSKLSATIMFSFRINPSYFIIVICIVNFAYSDQSCPEEATGTVTWPQSPDSSCVQSEPICFNNETLIMRTCKDGIWIPSSNQLMSCSKSMNYFDSLSCPKGFFKISDDIIKYCYKISQPSAWDYPCFDDGGATIMTEFNKEETDALLNSLLNFSDYKYFWLPAKRTKVFAPLVWYVPGSNWGQSIEITEHMPIRTFSLKNCLLLDVERHTLTTESCDETHPSLCFFINDFDYPARCQDGYRAYRHMTNGGTCFGIEKIDKNLSYTEFTSTNCNKPMGKRGDVLLKRHLFSKLATSIDLPDNIWCWFGGKPKVNKNEIIIDKDCNDSHVNSEQSDLRNIINKAGTTGWLNYSKYLPCMACESDIVYTETELSFEYNDVEKILYLTVYFPSGLWKYITNEKGIQCFSDAKGFFKVIDVQEPTPFTTTDRSSRILDSLETAYIEKETYVINLVTDRSARYWCEGHTKNNFSLITTEKIVVNPKGKEVHVYALVLDMHLSLIEIRSISELTENLSTIFYNEQILLMDILEYDLESTRALLHIHTPINETYKEESLNLLYTLNALKHRAYESFPKYNYILVNISSSVYCLPTTSEDVILLDWDLTAIGYIAAPKQFCLQRNGLPVNRLCLGSYLLGGRWGYVDGQCDNTHEPSGATIMLFNFVQGNLDSHFASHFLTVALEFVLNDTNILIPGDIYYLSRSLQSILKIANKNETYVETGDIDNIAWIMDRIMVLDHNYLHLAQTLNSTNVILDSMSSILTLITNLYSYSNTNKIETEDMKCYQLAVQPKFIVQISYPDKCNITGLAIINNFKHTANFRHMEVIPLFKNTTITDVMSIQNLEVATWLPHHVLKQIKRNNDTRANSETDNFHVVINVYYDNVIFQEMASNENIVNSRIVEVSIPGFTTKSQFSLPLVFKSVNDSDSSKACGYWDLQTQIGKIPGIWSTRGCILLAKVKESTICECYHLTHFGQLFNVHGSNTPYELTPGQDHSKALNIITVVGSSLSLLGIVGIWITAITFDMWRKKTGTKVLLQLSLAIALPLILIIFFNLDVTIVEDLKNKEHNISSSLKIICIFVGAIFHYSVLANFVWMLITAVLQFLRYVRVLGVSRPSRFMIKLSAIGWGLPCLPVIIVLIIDTNNYLPSVSMRRNMCYPSGLYMIIGVVLPICVILLINIILFLLVIKAISTKSDMRTTDRSLVYAQLRLSIFLFFLLGLTWIFGVLSFFGNIIFSYLFCLTATVQGFVLFVYFIVCDPTTRKLWATLMKPQFTSSRNSITTLSSG